MTLMDIKSNHFNLLISGTPLPIVYAMRLGKSRELFLFSSHPFPLTSALAA